MSSPEWPGASTEVRKNRCKWSPLVGRSIDTIPWMRQRSNCTLFGKIIRPHQRMDREMKDTIGRVELEIKNSTEGMEQPNRVQIVINCPSMNAKIIEQDQERGPKLRSNFGEGGWLQEHDRIDRSMQDTSERVDSISRSERLESLRRPFER